MKTKEARKNNKRKERSRKAKGGNVVVQKLNSMGLGERTELTIRIGGGILFILILSFCAYAAYNAISKSRYSICNLAEAEPDSFIVNQCHAEKCPFDISQCDFSCPFGFTSVNNCPVSCDCSSDGLFEGDIQFNEEELPYMLEDYGYVDENSDLSLFSGGSVSKSRYLWGDNIIGELFFIFYVVDELPGENVFSSSKFTYAIKDFDTRTCIRFRPKGNNQVKYYITLSSRYDGCWSAIGKETDNVRNQTVNIGSGCNKVQIIQHQLLHTLGFRHEQARSDRDNFVTINADNVKSGDENNFQKLRVSDAQDLGSGYDYTSITHFSTFAFTKNGQPTITLKSGENFIKRSRLMSEDDVYELNRLYPCPSKGGEEVEGSVTEENKGEVRFVIPPPMTPAPFSQWGFWGAWTSLCECREGYRGPVKLRTRSCPDGIGKCGDSSGQSDVFNCELKTCPKKAVSWMEWTSWTNCTSPCNQIGIVIRVRACSGVGCEGKASSTKSCTGYCEPTTAVVKTTAISSTTTNLVVNTSTTTTTPAFVITPKSTTPFSSLPGELNAQWSPWGEYSPCSTTCGDQSFSTCSRQRTCLKGRLRTEKLCRGDETEYKFCYISMPCNMIHLKPQFNKKVNLVGGSSGLTPGVEEFCGVKKEVSVLTTITLPILTTTLKTTTPVVTTTTPVTTTTSTTTEVTTTTPVTTTKVTTTTPITTTEVTTTTPVSTTKVTTTTPITTNEVTVSITTKQPFVPIKGTISFKRTPVPNMMKVLCEQSNYRSPGKLSFGDFNGDGRMDAICESELQLDIGLSNIDGSINKVHWSGIVSDYHCQSDADNINADFNGDGLDDFLCRGAIYTAIHLSSNGEIGAAVYNDRFCAGGLSNTVLLAADINGDGKADLVCKTIRNEKFEVKINQYV